MKADHRWHSNRQLVWLPRTIIVTIINRSLSCPSLQKERTEAHEPTIEYKSDITKKTQKPWPVCGVPSISFPPFMPSRP